MTISTVTAPTSTGLATADAVVFPLPLTFYERPACPIRAAVVTDVTEAT
jgi:hypothetical protein